MKKSSLKFKKLYEQNLSDLLKPYESTKIKNQTENLQLKRKRSKIQVSFKESKRPQSANSKPKSRVFSANHQKYQSGISKVDEQKFTVLDMDISNLLKNRSPAEVELIKEEFQVILSLIKNIKNHKQQKLLSKLAKFEDNISKTLKNRVSQLLFYILFAHFHEITNKDSEQIYEKQKNKLLLCEYYSRKLALIQISFSICMRIQELYCLLKKYDMSKKYARKCLRIAVFLRDRDSQFKVIENFKLINYYTGVICKYPTNFITKKERMFIWDNYNLQDDLPQIFQGKTRENSISYVYDFQNSGNYIEKPQFSKNYFTFMRNYNFIQKNIIQISKSVQKTLKKVSDIGKIHKYIDENNYIELQPRSPNMQQQNQGQVFLTHRKRLLSTNFNEDKFKTCYLPHYQKMFSKFCK